jgi:hypothetical protein
LLLLKKVGVAGSAADCPNLASSWTNRSQKYVESFDRFCLGGAIQALWAVMEMNG